MRSRTLPGLLVTAALLSVGGASAQVTSDIRDIKPMVMLLVDTSGSMERVPGANTLPSCSLTSSDERNRWAVTLEVLTGEIMGSTGVTPADGFKCDEEVRNSSAYLGEYDYGYHLPHYEFMDFDHDGTIDVDQGQGVIDTFSDRLRFGLMTFDGVGTILGENPLMELSTLQSYDYDDAPGMYSYGENKQLIFPGCETDYWVNAGARRKAKDPMVEPVAPAGALISVGSSDNPASIAAVNQAVQDSLIRVRPFGGTPTSAMLDDLRYYLENDSDVKDGGSDLFYECRSRVALLITDGAPDKMFRDDRYNCQAEPPVSTDPPLTCLDGDPCVCPYEESQDIAANLVSSGLLSQLFVVAFDVSSDPDALAALEQIADAGNDGLLNGETDLLYSADDKDALEFELRRVLGDIHQVTATRTIPVTVSRPFTAGGGTPTQYEIRSGFQFVDEASGLRAGFIERRRFDCNANLAEGLTITDDDRLEVELNGADARAIYTFNLASGMAPFGTVVGSAASSLFGYSPPSTQISFLGSSVGDPSDLEPVPLNQDQVATNVGVKTFDDFVSSSALATEFLGATAPVTEITEFLMASGALPATNDKVNTNRLRDILHSTPAVLNTSETLTSSAVLKEFRGLFLEGNTFGYDPDFGRPITLFVGTNDGVLHAFNVVDEWKSTTLDPDGPVEFWGFVPPAVLSSLKTAAAPSHVPLFDGSPIVQDMILAQNRGSAGSPPCDPDFLVGGDAKNTCMGTVLLAPLRGSATYLALNVTQPEKEPVPFWQLSDGQLGATVAAPALAHVDVDVGSGLQRRAIAILPGGAGALDSGTPVSWSGHLKPTAPNAVRANGRDWKSTGRLLLVVDVQSGEVLRRFDSRFFPAPISGAVAVDGEDLGVTRYAYFTDADGVLWRLSLRSSDPADWVVEPIWDVFHADGPGDGSESTFAPVITRDFEGNTTILLGTGSLDVLSGPSAQHYVVSLKQTFDESGELTVTANWEYPLQPGELVTGPLALFNEAVYFGTLVSSAGADACSAGVSRLWGVHFVTTDPGDDLPLAALPTESGTSLVRYEEQPAESGSDLVLGVSITRQPVCVAVATDDDPILGTRFVSAGPPQGGAYMVKGLRSGGTEGSPSGSLMADVTRTLTTRVTARVVSQAGSLE